MNGMQDDQLHYSLQSIINSEGQFRMLAACVLQSPSCGEDDDDTQCSHPDTFFFLSMKFISNVEV